MGQSSGYYHSKSNGKHNLGQFPIVHNGLLTLIQSLPSLRLSTVDKPISKGSYLNVAMVLNPLDPIFHQSTLSISLSLPYINRFPETSPCHPTKLAPVYTLLSQRSYIHIIRSIPLSSAMASAAPKKSLASKKSKSAPSHPPFVEVFSFLQFVKL